MFERDFTPLFKLEHMLKDVRHCLDEAARWAWSCGWARWRSRCTREAAEGPRRGGLRGGDPGTRTSANARNFP